MTKIIESRLTYIKRIQGGKHPRGLYRCVCGTEKEITEHSVRNGIVVSCGCYHKEVAFKHGLRGHTLYSVWSKMKHRCNCEGATKFHNYGGRGVSICPEWDRDFMAFYNWAINNGWKEGLQLDKDIIPKKNGVDAVLYSPNTCCFVTPKENNNSKRTNRYIEYNGVVKTISEWSEMYGIAAYTLGRRLGGKSKIEDDSIFRPTRYKSPNKKKNTNE